MYVFFLGGAYAISIHHPLRVTIKCMNLVRRYVARWQEILTSVHKALPLYGQEKLPRYTRATTIQCGLGRASTHRSQNSSTYCHACCAGSSAATNDMPCPAPISCQSSAESALCLSASRNTCPFGTQAKPRSVKSGAERNEANDLPSGGKLYNIPGHPKSKVAVMRRPFSASSPKGMP